MGIRQYDIEVPFGVLEVEPGGVRITGITEKPVLRQFINAGIYIVNPALCSLIPPNCRFDMPDLIVAAIGEKKVVISFPVREYWLDIGRVEHYEKAEADMTEGLV
ncbi:MAG: sugar phosphate nucleotidyltransferase [Terriglobales bacterium]